MSKESAIPVAFSEELGVVSIEEARAAYLAQSNPDKRYSFVCADESCRIKISAVNCYNEVFETTPHFRKFPNTEHSTGCIYGVYSDIYGNMLKNKLKYRKCSMRNAFVRVEGSEKIPDVFILPGEFSSSLEEKGESLQKTLTSSRNIRKTVEGIILKGKLRTTSFDELVNAFELLKEESRHLFHLSLDGRKMKYSLAFKRICFIRENHFWTHVFYGRASIYKAKTGYQAYFSTQPYYDEAGSRPKVVSFFSNEMLDKDPAGKRLRTKLEEAVRLRESGERKHVCLYILGKQVRKNEMFKPGEASDSVHIESRSSSGITIRYALEKCK